VGNDGDCWRWLPRALETATPGNRGSLLESIALLGRRTGELHAALAGSTEDDAFRPEPYTIEDVDAEGARIAGELASTLSMIRRQRALTDEESASLESALRDRLSGIGILEGLPRIRVHGDFHLGQVLRVGDDFVIIDFEGEPSRPMPERRQKHSPLKDVAGMLRSLDYAATSARLSMKGETDGDLQAWSVTAERAFLVAYRESILGAPIQLVPGDDAGFQVALDLFMIEKALYEARYELDNRPDWLGIPLDGLRRVGARN
jgi:maltose alpha-D-glucosyltransferase/alpha-amylase